MRIKESMKKPLKEYRFPGDNFIFYGREETDALLSEMKTRFEILNSALDEQYKINLSILKDIDKLKAKNGQGSALHSELSTK